MFQYIPMKKTDLHIETKIPALKCFLHMTSSMKMTRRFFIPTIILMIIHGVIQQANAQNPEFQEIALDLGIYINYQYTMSGQGVSFFDFNEDGWDDLTLCQTNGPVILYQNLGGYFEPLYYFYAGQHSLSSGWGDLDNDGKNDLVITTFDDGIHIYKNLDNQNFSDITQLSTITPQSNQLYSGIAFSDINRDGLLDIAVANYSDQSKNQYLVNMGELHFESLNGDAGFLNVQKHAFQPAFIDLNRDLWPDLYMINDFYEGNEFYWNNGSSSFSENDTTLGLNIQADAMSNSWNDFDRDGDLDLYVTNRFFGNHFMQQTENQHFQNIIDQSGTNVLEWCWSATWIDAENNGYDDLLVTKNSTDIITDTNGNYLFINLNEGFFALNNGSAHFPTNGFTAAVGDLNNDGKGDVGISTRQGYNFQLFQNNTNTQGNYFKFRLEGHLSNRNGIGTHYDIWTNNRRHYGYTQAGENYLAQNSQNKIIGIGFNNIVDSIILRWPSGAIDKYYNLAANQLHVLHELQNPEWWWSSDTMICASQDTVWIETNPLLQATWWDGTTDSVKIITQPGTYHFNLTAEFGQSRNFSLVIHSPFENISTTVTDNICALDSMGSIIVWNDESNLALYQAQNLPAGEYLISFEVLGCPKDTAITINHSENWLWNAWDTIWQCPGEVINWPEFNLDSSLTLISQILETGMTYTTTWQNEQGCLKDTIITIYQPTIPNITTNIQETATTWLCDFQIVGGEGPFTTSGLDWQNGQIVLSEAGIYPYQVIDRWGCSYLDTLNVQSQTSQIEINNQQQHWVFDPPYLYGKTDHSIQVFNALGQSLPIHRIGDAWILPENSFPIVVCIGEQFYPISWYYRR